ncbi:MAG: nitronate monooxygenase, partial [Sedimentibacter sp.]|uniref:nitronate monooxygenase n=1 Tax=Sedimentibacter sp. TaxID=1960295 RepID=UPI002982015D
IAAGGTITKEYIFELKAAGDDGFQLSSVFVPTVECDAHENFKLAYINAKNDDPIIIKSPVGMPARAIPTNFLMNSMKNRCVVNKCFQCMPNCDPLNIPYCISKGLIDSVQGKDGLIFSGANLGTIDKMTTVKEVINKLIG